MPFLTKIWVSSGLVAAVAGGGYFAGKFFFGETLGRSLESRGHTLLSFDLNNASDKSVWDPIVKAYAKSTKKFNGVSINLNSDNVTQESVNILKNECSKAVELNRYDLDIGFLAEQFCVTPTNIKSLIDKQNSFRMLNSKTDGSQVDNVYWDSKIRVYLNSSKDKQMRETVLLNGDLNLEVNREKIKKACQGLETPLTYQSNFTTIYNQFLDWCVVNKDF